MEMHSATGQINIVQLMSMRNSSGRISMPVSRIQSPYAQFKYVQGVPASSQGHAVPLNRLRVLNNLIDSLVSLKDGNVSRVKTSGLSDKAIDALINQYAGELHTAISSQAGPYTAGASYTTGSLVNVTA